MNFVLFVGILLVLGLASTRVVKKVNLPNVTGYLIVGLIASIICILFDQFVFNDNFLSSSLDKLNSIVSSVALGFIAISIGEEFRLSKMKRIGGKIVTITIIQALSATLFVDIALIIACVCLNLNVSIAICLGAIATATEPAATLMVIHQYKAKGKLVDTLIPVVAFDDAVGLVVFSVSVAIAKIFASGNGVSFISLVLMPLLEIIGSLLVGFLLGLLMHIVIKFFKSRNNHVIILIAFTLLGVGICNALNLIKIDGSNLELSNLLCCMMIGAVHTNLAKDDEQRIVDRDVDLLDHWSTFLIMLFFVLSGAHLVTSSFNMFTTYSSTIIVPTIIIFVVYVVFRSLGKYTGAFVGCSVTKQDKGVRNYLGLTLLPQAGVAIGMANQIANMSDFSKDNLGNIIITVVLCGTLIYELVGPLLTKFSLVKVGEINPNIEENTTTTSNSLENTANGQN